MGDGGGNGGGRAWGGMVRSGGGAQMADRGRWRRREGSRSGWREEVPTWMSFQLSRSIAPVKIIHVG